MDNKIEIMAPAGNFEALAAAIQGGANSVYFGIGELNMRSHSANNFAPEDLKKITEICAQNNIKSYLPLNIILYDEELEKAKEVLNLAKEAGVSAVIASDISAILYARSIGLEVHISTQANISNIEAVRFYAQYADVVVLARELTLTQVKKIYDTIQRENICGPAGVLPRSTLHGSIRKMLYEPARIQPLRQQRLMFSGMQEGIQGHRYGDWMGNGDRQ